MGAGLSMAQRKIEVFLNGVVFHKQMLALQGLRRFALETDLIADPSRLLSQTHEALTTRLESEYVAIYTADGSSYTPASTRIEALPALLAGDDFAVLRLRRWHEAFEPRVRLLRRAQADALQGRQLSPAAAVAFEHPEEQ